MPYGTVNADVIGTSVTGSNLGAGNASIMKNRIINGAMVIDQRNAGATVAFGAGYVVYVDRWTGRLASGSGSPTIGQSTTAPIGFANSLLITNGTGASPTISATNALYQGIEGYNTADLNFGTANAKTVTLSFWVRSSLTGTFGGSLSNGDSNRSYPFTYTISSANTFEYKTITIAGDTTGTWQTTNLAGFYLWIDLGTGTSFQGTAGAWASADYRAATGCTQIVANTGATFYLTGVQLEVGSSATGFEYRQYGQELALCQRYFQSYAFGSQTVIAVGQCDGTSSAQTGFRFNQQMRTAPSITLPAAGSGSGQMSFLTAGGTYPGTFGSFSALYISNVNFQIQQGGVTGAFVAGNASWLYPTGTAVISASAEL
jgi:hypothetical protein